LVERSGLLGGNPYQKQKQVYETSPSIFRSSPRAASVAALGGRDAELPASHGPKRSSHGAIDFDGREVDSSIFRGPGGAR
jgi:hypothetical protein